MIGGGDGAVYRTAVLCGAGRRVACVQRPRVLDFFDVRDLAGTGRSGLLQCKQRTTSDRVERWQAGQYMLGIEVMSAIARFLACS